MSISRRSHAPEKAELETVTDWRMIAVGVGQIFAFFTESLARTAPLPTHPARKPASAHAAAAPADSPADCSADGTSASRGSTPSFSPNTSRPLDRRSPRFQVTFSPSSNWIRTAAALAQTIRPVALSATCHTRVPILMVVTSLFASPGMVIHRC